MRQAGCVGGKPVEDNRGPGKSYIIAGLAALVFWLTATGLECAFREPADFTAFLLPREATLLWMRLLLSIIVAFLTINRLDRDAAPSYSN